jgi:hypothetical protein
MNCATSCPLIKKFRDHNTVLCVSVCSVSCSHVPATWPYPGPCRAINVTIKLNYYRFCFEVLGSFLRIDVHRASLAHTEDTPLLVHPCERHRVSLDGMLLIGTSRTYVNAHVWRHQYIWSILFRCFLPQVTSSVLISWISNYSFPNLELRARLVEAKLDARLM